MHRRSFHKKLVATLGFGTLLAACSSTSKVQSTSNITKSTIKPKRLKSGDRIGLITPGSYIADDALEKAVQNLEKLGFKVELGKNIRAKRGFNAGTDAQRLEDLHTMFRNKDIDGIWCARGGYGCSRLLPYIDYKLLQNNPKVLIGYSDITALLQAIYLKTGLVGFHGPVGASEMTEYTQKEFVSVVMEGVSPHRIELPGSQPEEAVYQAYPLKAGKAKGALIGGNLSLVVSLAGTAFQIDFRDKLVFLEDVGEKPYRLDRMLTHLRQSYQLSNASGIALGVFNGCEAKADDLSLSLKETLSDRLSDLDCPSFYGFSFGHIDNNCTLPIGILAEMDTQKQSLTLLEPAVI